MFYVTKRLEISASHQLTLPYESKCNSLHGHNWIIEITCACRQNELEYGMVFDFTRINRLVKEKLDHKDITRMIIVNDRIANPTAENIAIYIRDMIGEKCIRVKVQESEGNCAIWERNNEGK